MPQVAIPFAARVAVKLTTPSEELINVFHVANAGLTEATAQLVAAEFATFYTGVSGAGAGNRGIRDLLATSVQLSSITVQEIDAVPYLPPYEFFYSVAGTDAGDELAPQTAFMIQWRTPSGGRSGKGRTFLGGFTENVNDDATSIGRPTDAFVDAVANAADDLMSRLDTLGADLSVVSYVDVVARKVTSCRLTNRWATQRRRARRIPATYGVTRVQEL